MSREFASINVGIRKDRDWRALPGPAQLLYWTLWAHPDLSYCGVLDWRPGRIGASTDGVTADDVRLVAQCLEARYFVVIDEDTEECLIRSWVRFDGLLKQPRLSVSFANAYAGVESEVISGVIVHEIAKLREAQPDLAAWSKSQVLDILAQPSVDPRSREVPGDPFPQGFGYGFRDHLGDGFGDRFGPGLGQASGRVSTSPTPAPAPAPSTCAPSPSGRKRPARTIPDDWKPNDTHVQMAAKLNLDLAREAMRFRNHAATNERKVRDWDAAFRNWLTNDRATPVAANRGQQPEGW